MLEWRTPTIADMPEMKRIISASGAEGSDACAANIFLLREKYNIKIAYCEGALLRLYTGTRLPGRRGVTFPLGGDTAKALDMLEKDVKERGKQPCFIFLTEEQRDILAKRYPDMRFQAFPYGSSNNYHRSYG